MAMNVVARKGGGILLQSISERLMYASLNKYVLKWSWLKWVGLGSVMVNLLVFISFIWLSAEEKLLEPVTGLKTIQFTVIYVLLNIVGKRLHMILKIKPWQYNKISYIFKYIVKKLPFVLSETIIIVTGY